MRATLVLMAVLLGSILVLTACGEGKEKEPQKLVPAGSTLIASIQLSEILEDEDLAALFGRIPKGGEDDPQTLDQLLDKATKEIGLDLRDFSQIVVFGDISRIEERFGLIARGIFEEDKLVEAITKANDWSLTATEYKDHQIHLNEEGRAGSGGLEALSFLGSDSLVLGTLEGVKSVIDVREGEKDRVSGDVHDAFTDLGDGLVRLAVEIPPEAVEDFELPFGGLPLDAGVLRDIKVVGILADKDGQNITLEARADFSDASSASNFGDVVDGLLKLLGGLASDEETKKVLKDVRISVDGTRLRVVSEISLTQLEELVLGTQNGFLGFLSPLRREESASATIIAPGRVTTPVPVPPPPAVAPLVPAEGAIQFPTLDSPHIPVGETGSYSTLPPTSGPHWPATAQCGIYDEELSDELVVHNMEHGHVVISHNLSDPDQERMLKDLAEGLPGLKEWAIVRPYSKIKPGTVAMTAWGVMDRISGVDEERIIRFYRTYRANRLSPETQQLGPIPCR